jgi:hypothetical protein
MRGKLLLVTLDMLAGAVAYQATTTVCLSLFSAGYPAVEADIELMSVSYRGTMTAKKVLAAVDPALAFSLGR